MVPRKLVRFNEVSFCPNAVARIEETKLLASADFFELPLLRRETMAAERRMGGIVPMRDNLAYMDAFGIDMPKRARLLAVTSRLSLFADDSSECRDSRPEGPLHTTF